MLSKRVNIAIEAIAGFQEGKVELCPGYEYVKPGSSRVVVALYNNTQEKIALTKGTIVAKVTTANAIPPMLALTKSITMTYPSMMKIRSQKHSYWGTFPKVKTRLNIGY